MAKLFPRDLPGLLPALRARPANFCHGMQDWVLAGWVEHLVEKKGEDFVRANSSRLLQAWDDFERECWL